MRSTHDDDLSQYFLGEQLYGDDFDLDEIKAWFEDEKEAYADLGAADREAYRYLYHELNVFHGFRHLKSGRRYRHALGFGSAYGDEFEPIANRIHRVTIIDPSGAFRSDEVHGIPATFVTPAVDGALVFEDATFDLITCLDVLHHIPNVRYVLSELGRVCAPGGAAVLREPVISMGDWTQPRRGLTSRERGIPVALLDEMIADAGFLIRHESFSMVSVMVRASALLNAEIYNSKLATRMDAVLAKLLRWNLKYHATSTRDKFRPTVKFYVLTRRSSE